MKTSEQIFKVTSYCSEGQAIDPLDGERLGKAVIGTTGRVTLDFDGIVVLASSYANAMFLAIQESIALPQLASRLSYKNVRPVFERVLEKSRNAVERASEQPRST